MNLDGDNNNSELRLVMSVQCILLSGFLKRYQFNQIGTVVY